MLSPERIRATTGGIVFLLNHFRFSDTSANNPSIVGSASHCNRSSPLHKGAKGDSALPTLPKPHFPSKSTISLPPLSKVRCCRPKKFGRLPEGLPQLHRPSPSPQPLQKDNSTLLRTKLASLVKGEVLLPEKIRAATGGIVLHPPTSPSPQPLQKDNNPSPHVCPFIQYVNHSQVCSPAHSSAFGTASPQDRYKAPK